MNGKMTKFQEPAVDTEPEVTIKEFTNRGMHSISVVRSWHDGADIYEETLKATKAGDTLKFDFYRRSRSLGNSRGWFIVSQYFFMATIDVTGPLDGASYIYRLQIKEWDSTQRDAMEFLMNFTPEGFYQDIKNLLIPVK